MAYFQGRTVSFRESNSIFAGIIGAASPTRLLMSPGNGVGHRVEALQPPGAPEIWGGKGDIDELVVEPPV